MERWNRHLNQIEHPVLPRGGRGGAFPLMPGVAPPPANGPQGTVLAVEPWWRFEYESAQDWYRKNLAVALPAAIGTTAVPAFSFTVPPNTRMVLKQFIIQITNPTNATDVVATLLRNGQPIAGFNAIAFLPMVAATEALPYNDLNIRFGGGDTFTASFTDNTATAWTVGITASGWFVGESDIQRLMGGVSY
jgi:hypothetical protein